MPLILREQSKDKHSDTENQMIKSLKIDFHTAKQKNKRTKWKYEHTQTWSTGSIFWKIDEGPSASARKFDTQETMQTLESGRTSLNILGKASFAPQRRTWQDFTSGLARHEFLLMFRRTFESPTMEKRRDISLRFASIFGLSLKILYQPIYHVTSDNLVRTCCSLLSLYNSHGTMA